MYSAVMCLETCCLVISILELDDTLAHALLYMLEILHVLILKALTIAQLVEKLLQEISSKVEHTCFLL